MYRRRQSSVLDDGSKIIFVLALLVALLLIWAVVAGLSWVWQPESLVYPNNSGSASHHLVVEL